MVAAQAVDLRADSRLEVRLTLAEPLIPLRELLIRFRQATGVPLYAAPEIADDKVCVIAWDQPAAETLTRLAETLRYSWARATDGKGYRLFQPAVERHRERELARLIRQSWERHITTRLRTLIRRARMLNYTQWREREAKNIPELDGNYLEAYWALQVLSLLPDAAWSQLWQEQSLLFSTRPSRDAMPLPDALAQQLREALASDADRRADFRHSEFVSVSIYYSRRTGDLSVIFRGAERNEYRLRSAHFRLRISDWDSFAASIEQHPLNREWREWASPPSETQIPPLQKNEATLTLMRRALEEPLRPLIAFAWAKQLNLIADTYRLRLADRVISEHRLDAPTSKSFPNYSSIMTMPSLLWLRQEGAWLLARHKEYPLLRPSEIPETLLRPLEQALAERKPFALDDWARLAAALTEPQKERLRGLQRLLYGVSEQYELNTPLPMGMVLAALPALHFWASLSPAQKQAVLNGGALEYRTLTPAQRALFEQAVRFRGDPHALTGPLITMHSGIGFRSDLTLPEYPSTDLSPETRRRLEAPIPATARLTVELTPLNLAESVRKNEMVAPSERDALLQQTQPLLDCEAWRLRFEVESAAREYYVYRTAPPAAGKTVRLH